MSFSPWPAAASGPVYARIEDQVQDVKWSHLQGIDSGKLLQHCGGIICLEVSGYLGIVHEELIAAYRFTFGAFRFGSRSLPSDLSNNICVTVQYCTQNLSL